MKTSELTGAALDWAVAKCAPDDTLAVYFDEDTGEPLCHDDWHKNQEFKPSTDWAQGGSIIEREKLCVGTRYTSDQIYWDGDVLCWARTPIGGYLKYGPTPLIAAMRCYVASKLGDNVDIPEELK